MFDGHFVWAGAPDFLDMLTRIMDQDIEASDCNNHSESAALPFAQEIGDTSGHFLDGFLGRAETSWTGLRRTGCVPKSLEQLSSASPTPFCSMARSRHPSSPSSSCAPSPKPSPRMPSVSAPVEAALPAAKRKKKVDRTERTHSKKKGKLTNRGREACESLRILVFGEVGNESLKEKDKDSIFEARRGTMEELRKFAEFWIQIDEDNSGDVDVSEFLEFFAKSKADHLLCTRVVKFLMGAGAGKAIADSNNALKASIPNCTREDMIRLIWPSAGDRDLFAMYQMFDLQKILSSRVKTPPLLPKKKHRQLLENFKFVDKQRRGHITYQDLTDSGLIDEEMMNDLRTRYDRSGQGIINQEDFLEMLCPFGCRAHDGVKEMLVEDEVLIRLVYIDSRHLKCGVDQFKGWLRDRDLQVLSGSRSNLPLSFEPLTKSEEILA